MTLLVNSNDFATHNRALTQSNYNNGSLDQSISDAQFEDVQGLMGLDFYNDLMRNHADTKYQDLLNGGTYTYKDITYTHHGLKSVIVYYAYSNYILFGSQVDTPFGLIEKDNNNSSRVTEDAKRTKAKKNQNLGYSYWDNVRIFLDRNADTYPLWNTSCIVKRGGFRISKII